MSHSVSNLSLGGSLINGDETPPTFDNNFGTAPNQSKIGATISRIPLGLFVYSVSTNSDAYTLGLRPGSILLSINNIGMLGETSHRALQRLWRYDGILDENDKELIMRHPVHLQLYNKGCIYSVCLLSANPLRGIEWAPCGNFGVVQRSSRIALQSGVRRGCLLLGVNKLGCRSLDHAGVACELTNR